MFSRVLHGVRVPKLWRFGHGALSFVVSEIQGLSEASMRKAWGTGQYGSFRKLGCLILRSFL